MKKIFLLLCMLCWTSVAHAADGDDWIKVASNNDGYVWLIKPGSLSIGENKSGKPIAIVIGVVRDKDQVNSYGKWYVTIEDCRNKMGTLVTCKLSGEFNYDNDFVIGGSSVSSAVAENICGAWEIRVRESDRKSL